MREKSEAVIRYRIYWYVLHLMFLACTYDTIDLNLNDCSDGSLSVQVVRSQNTIDCSASMGIIEVLGVGGVSPYRFSLANKEPQANTIFIGLSAGEYIILVLDARNCSDTTIHYLPAAESNLSAYAITMADSGCLSNVNNGTIKVSALNGKPPYQFQLSNQSFSNDSIFDNLKFGSYTVNVRDAVSCQFSLDVIVPRLNSGVNWQADVRPIISKSCAKSGCHDDKSGRTNLIDFENIKENLNQIRLRIINRSMPFDATLSEEQIRLIVCWIDDGAPEN